MRGNTFFILFFVYLLASAFISCQGSKKSDKWENLFDIALTYYGSQKYDSTLIYLDKSLERLEENSFYEIALVNQHKSSVYLERYEPQKARSIANIALEACERKLDDATNKLVPIIYFNIAVSYLQEGNFDTFIEFSQESISFMGEVEKAMDPNLFDLIMGAIGAIQYEQGNIESAVFYLSKAATKNLKETNPERYVDYESFLAYLNEERHNRPDSLNNLKSPNEVKTELSEQKNAFEPKYEPSLEITYAILKRDFEAIKRENESLSYENWESNNGMWAFIILVFVLLIVGAIYYKRHQKELKRLKYEYSLREEQAKGPFCFQPIGEKEIICLQFGDIMHIQKVEYSPISIITLKDGRKFEVRKSIKAFQEEFPYPLFFRARQSYLINTLEITSSGNREDEKGGIYKNVKIGELEIRLPKTAAKDLLKIVREN